ncbi:MAG: YgiW/YdeI family stress tolerance OB fold protein [Alphaproteobacteria bacterium]|nr:YgiW/YdeI family stress tolerance OB fold protein [Alphaproteobacteria bacterium]
MNKLLSVSAFVLALSFANSVMAGFDGTIQNSGGFKGPEPSVNTVAEALKMSDDMAVVLEGKIEKSLGNEEYLFTDSTGSVTVEIDDDNWRGVTVTPEDTVVIKGEVEKDMFKTEIEVDSLRLKK